MLAAVALGCSAQTGPGYTGEVMLKLAGSVDLQGPAAADSNPALAFETAAGYALVHGEVEGIFPSDFELSFTRPPPRSALHDGWASGYVTFAPPDVERLELAGRNDDFWDECPGTGDCTWTERTSLSDGTYLERDYTCEFVECELVESSGDESVWEDYGDPTAGVAVTGGQRCDADECRLIEQACSEDDTCHRRSYTCPLGEGRRIDGIVDGRIAECRVTDTRGDASVLERSERAPASSNYLVLYLRERDVLPVGFESAMRNAAALKAGYNLLEIAVPTGQALSLRWCAHRGSRGGAQGALDEQRALGCNPGARASVGAVLRTFARRRAASVAAGTPRGVRRSVGV